MNIDFLKPIEDGHWFLTPVIPSTPVAEIIRIMVQS
jgi:hypothetical protein